MIERYSTELMSSIWHEKNYYKKWLEVEAMVLLCRGDKELSEKLLSLSVSPEDIRQHEKISGHELNSFLEIIENKLSAPSASVHSGMTSADVMDTARMLQVKDSLAAIEQKLSDLNGLLREKAVLYKHLAISGRTHGQVAEVTTLGLKFLRYSGFVSRNIARLKQSHERLFVGKIAGAVGTYSLISPDEERAVLDKMGLKPVSVSSQVLPRDLFAEYVFLLSLVSSSAEEIALEIRILSQDGIKELAEPFSEKQSGSSAMPHKQNPVLCEKISGLARLVRNYSGLALENITLWNERDISHSSNERIMLEDVSSLTYYILEKLFFVVSNIRVFEDAVRKNLASASPKIYSSGVLNLLLERGIARKDAYALVKALFISGRSTKDIIEKLTSLYDITAADIENVMNPEYYLKNIEHIYKRNGL